MWALEPDCPGQSLLVEDCGLLEDGALGLLTAAISQPGNFPHVTDGETEAQRGQLAFWRPQSRSMAAKELLHHGSLGSAPASISPVTCGQAAPPPPSPTSRQRSHHSAPPQTPGKAGSPEGSCDLRLGPSESGEQVEAGRGGSASRPARRPIWTGRPQPDLWAGELGYFGGGTGGPGLRTGGRGVSCPCCRLRM